MILYGPKICFSRRGVVVSNYNLIIKRTKIFLLKSLIFSSIFSFQLSMASSHTKDLYTDFSELNLGFDWPHFIKTVVANDRVAAAIEFTRLGICEDIRNDRYDLARAKIEEYQYKEQFALSYFTDDFFECSLGNEDSLKMLISVGFSPDEKTCLDMYRLNPREYLGWMLIVLRNLYPGEVDWNLISKTNPK